MDESFEKWYEAAEILTPYGSAFRYPGEDFEPEIEDVFEALDYAREIINFIIGIYLRNKDYKGSLID